MIAIIYDLELVKRFKKGQLSEIVEIGACKVDLQKKEIIDELQIYMLPRSGYIPKSTRKFIKMTKEDVKKAIPFNQGIELFSSWLGENYYLCSWGKDDKVHLMDQCLRNKIPLDWFINYNDIQRQIGKALGNENANEQVGLKKALQIADIDPIGKAHRGIDDTINTALLFIKYIDQVTLIENKITEKELKLLKNKQKRKRKVSRRIDKTNQENKSHHPNHAPK
ncbi:exonuclease domain-containing protein [Evansella sp. AB-P1]|uniref:3'-5' exonuclease n=1 Tax=Evansella sp. AB-P1 TaxID=3037653 RepID=UPI00241CBE87|nr:3'-5' exonuclease [Evansella sp. AB-P1]MDG5788431.1 exonuclease domain-containing protein [Evansella sp. AB-P1]